jgi:hypothetical protein
MESCASELGSDALVFARSIASGPVPITLSREAGYHHPRAEVAHLHHPLVRFAVREVLSSDEQRHAAFALSIPEGKLPSGSYGFLIAMVHVKSHRPIAKLVAALASVAGDRVLVEPEETTPIIIEMLEQGRDVETRPLAADQYSKLKHKLLTALEGLKAEWDARERRLDRARGEQQHAALRATLDFRVRQASERVETLIRSSADEFAVRMARARLDKAQREHDAFASAAIRTTWGGIEHEELAVGLLQVGGKS